MSHSLDSRLKILVAVASHGTSNDCYLFRLISEYRAMPFDIDIVVLSNVHKQVPDGVELVVGPPNKNPWSLPFGHKRIFAERSSKYDLFIYSEDDILITKNNIRAFVQVSTVLPKTEIPGFLRFEIGADNQVYYPEVHGRFHWHVGSVRTRGPYTLAYFTNEHSACYVMTREHLLHAIESGGFLVEPHEGKYDLLCTAATDPYTQCGFQKLICVSHLTDFMVHHLSNKYLARMGMAQSEVLRQIEALLSLKRNGNAPSSLFQTETKLWGGRYSKLYYEPVFPEIVSSIPSGVRSILSVGCGWGATEARLAESGFRVTAVPLDPVIPGRAKATGVRVIDGDFKAAYTKLADERFDCLLLANVLHLVENPVEVLSCFVGLLDEGAVVIALLPNHLKLSILWKKFRGLEGLQVLGSFAKSGVHFTSHLTVRRWFRQAGLQIDKITNILPERAQLARRFGFGLINPLFASQFVAAAKKSNSCRRRNSY